MKTSRIIRIALLAVPIMAASWLQAQWYQAIRENIVDTLYSDDGRMAVTVRMPGIPPENYRAPVAEYTRTTVILPLVPAFSWSFGCSATSAAMIAGHYDNMGYPNMYVGPTNNGVMPMDNSSWRDTIISGQNRHQCPLSATCENWDGRTTPGHVDDYWRWYLAPGPDPWTVAGGGTGVQHAYGLCTGDYMKTNQWLIPGDEINVDGSTSFTYWTNGAVFSDDDAEDIGCDDTDGMYGFRLFMESRGYTVMSTFTQLTYDPDLDFWFDFNDFKWEIDNNRPVLIHVEGHTMVGYGYDNGGGDSIIYIHDTWDYSNHTMRWNASYNGMSQWGVTVMRLLASTINVWTGDFNNYWGNDPNWSLGHVPTAGETVVIPDLNTPVIVDYSNKVCGNLSLYPGAVLRIMAYDLNISGDFHVYGEIEFNAAGGSLTVGDDIFWYDGSVMDENTTTAFEPEINIAGDFECLEGSNILMNYGVVDFTGTANSWIRIKSPDVEFHHFRNYKTGGGGLGLGTTCTYECLLNGNLYMYSGSLLQSNSMYNWTIEGFLNNMGGNIRLGSGTLRFNGNPGSIGLKPNSGDYVNNLVINTGSYTLSLDNSYSSALTIDGNLTIMSGVLDANAFLIDINGNWTNSAGISGFQEETSRVMFSGTGYQYINTDENFNILEANSGAMVRVNGTGDDVVCNLYDWTAGGIEVLEGSFTALDLAENGIYGNFYLDPGGTINLTQDASQHIDIDGNIYMDGGTFNIYGGDGSSWWAYASAASLEMSGGILNFANYGIYLSNNYAFTDNITGGTIRTVGVFDCLRTDFNPTGGTLEMVNTYDANLKHAAGSNLYNVIINKMPVGPESDGNSPKPPLLKRIPDLSFQKQDEDRTGPERKKEPPASRSNTITLTGNLDINGSLTISNGVLDVSANNYTINIAGDWTNNAGASNFVERMGQVIFDGAGTADINTNETFFILKLNKTYADFDGLELDAGITVNVLEDLSLQDGTLEMNSSTTIDINDDLTISSGAGLNANDGLVSINLASDWTNSNAGFSTIFGFSAGTSSTVTFDGASNQYLNTSGTEEVFNHLIIAKASGNFAPYDNIVVTGDMDLNTGIWDDESAFRIHEFYGDFTVATGASYVGSGGNTVMFVGSADQVITFDPDVSGGSFYDVVVDKSITGDNIPSGDENQKLAIPLDGNRSNLVTLATDIIALNSGMLTVNYGTLDLNGHYFRAVGDVKIKNGGKISIDNDAWLEVGGSDSLIVFSGGTLEVVGANGHEAKVKEHSNYYAFVVQSGGNISARHAIFENMDANGVNIQSGALVNATNDFDFCTFQDGYAGTATLFTINNNQTFTIDSANFPTSTTTKNVTKTINQGQVDFVGATGAFAGPAFENDANSRINWAEHGIWEGTVSTDWNTTTNWGFDLVPTASVDVVIPAGCPYYPVMTGSFGVNTASYLNDCKSLTIDNGGSLTYIANSSLYNYGVVNVDGMLAIGNDYHGYSGSVLNLTSDTVMTGTISSDGRVTLYSGGVVNQTGGHFLAESWNLASGCQYNGNGGDAHLYVNGTALTAQPLYMNDAESFFFNLFVNDGANGTLSSSAEDLDCNASFEVEGTFNPYGKTVTATYMDVMGTLNIDSGLIHVEGNGPYFHSNGVLNMTGGTIDAGNGIHWYPNSGGSITGGSIYAEDYWNFHSGSNVLMGSGSTIYFEEPLTTQITVNDDNSTFGTVIFNKPNAATSDIEITTGASTPMRIDGNLTVNTGNQCILDGEMIVTGEIINAAGSEIDVNSGSNLEAGGNLTLNGFLNIANGEATIHGVYDHSASGDLVINGGSFECDHAFSGPRSVYYINGDFTMGSGIFEICHNHLSFGATATENITGGTIRVGGSFLAYSSNFTPSGGTVELINYSGGGNPYIEVTSGSYLNNLTVSGNTTWLLGGAGTSHLYINNDLTINSGALNGSDDFIYLDDDWINNAGNSGFIPGTGRVYLTGTVPTPEVQQIAGTTTFYDLTNMNLDAVVRIDGPVTVNHMYESGAGGPTCETFVVGSPFNIPGQLLVSQGAFALSASAPVVNTGSLVQGGTILITNGTLNVDDLSESGIYGSWTIYNGTVNLTQDGDHFFDLYADLHIHGGAMNLINGTDLSYWPGAGAPIMEMSAGVLDFQNVGIRLLNNNMAYNITGGSIKTTGNFIGEAACTVFDPTGGNVEMYGNTLNTVKLGPGSFFYDLIINKTSSQVNAAGSFPVKHELKVEKGTFSTNGFAVTVGP